MQHLTTSYIARSIVNNTSLFLCPVHLSYLPTSTTGVVQRWQGPVGVLRPGGRFEPLGDAVPLYVAVGGMRQLAQHMADQVMKITKGLQCQQLYLQYQ
jgi:predicted NAD/FAD-dependent oxidoreductase